MRVGTQADRFIQIFCIFSFVESTQHVAVSYINFKYWFSLYFEIKLVGLNTNLILSSNKKKMMQ